MLRSNIVLIVAAGVLGGCGGGSLAEPALDQLRQPTGLALTEDGQFLFVSNGNWDLSEAGGTIVVLDFGAAVAAVAGALPGAQTEVSAARPCRRSAVAGPAVECDAAPFILAEHSVVVGAGLSNIALDRPVAAGGRFRVLVPQRVPPALVWLDVTEDLSGIAVDCGQDTKRRCDALHQVSALAENPEVALPGDPSRIVLDNQGFRFGYIPHLTGGQLSLIDLDGRNGPELSIVESEFFREGELEGLTVRGGFGVAQRSCDPSDPPNSSVECSRPFLYATHRYFPGLRSFAVAVGLEVILPAAQISASPIGSDVVQARPIMGDLAFETDTSLLVVQTTPAGLGRVDTSLDRDGDPRDQVLDVVPLCANPNLIKVYQPAGGSALALVSCFGDGALAVVELDRFELVATIELGMGTNEIAIDDARGIAVVANTRESSISLVDLDRRRPSFLTEIARLGAVGIERQ